MPMPAPLLALPLLALPLLALLAAPALATPEYVLPTLFDVTGVAADDVLNVRAEPSAAAPVIGTLAPDATRIEVTAETRGWARINTGEAAGWVAARYLAYRSDVWTDGALPQDFACLGTEPFWSLTVADGTLILSEPERESQFPVTAILGTGGFRDPMRAISAGEVTLVATPETCSDGMSDRLFGLRASLVQAGGQPRLLSGCCMIQPPGMAPRAAP